MVYRPHDLLRLAPFDLGVPDDAPAWAARELAREEPWVVVRRAVPEPGIVPVGVRGGARHERYAFSAPLSRVRERVTPERLAKERRWRMIRASRGRLPAFAALEDVAELLERHRLAWGPVGSVGFELATGVPVVTEESDLDLILRCPDPLPQPLARELIEDLGSLPVRADAQIDTENASLALKEWADRGDNYEQVMLRRAEGPVLTRDPWPKRADVFAGERRS